MEKIITPFPISIVIPVYNEHQRFLETFPTIVATLNIHPHWEVIFINDGSTDDTYHLIQTHTKAYPQICCISYKKNQGKGHALKRGIMKAQKPWVLITDIDLSTPLSELELLAPFMQRRADLIIGTRKVLGAKLTQRQSWFREWCGQQFTKLTNVWLGLDISDFTCGFKLIRTPIAKQLFRSQQIRRWSFDAELLFLAKRRRFSIVEVPVTWHNDPRSKVDLWQDAFQALSDLIKIRKSWWLGKYH